MFELLRRYSLSAIQLLLFAGLAQASMNSPEAVVRQATENMYRALQQECLRVHKNPERLRALVDEHLMPHADFMRMSRLVMGKYWKTASEDQRQAFIREFRMLLIRTYATAVEGFSPDHIRYLPMRPSTRPGRAVVRTEFRLPGEPMVPVSYRMYKKDGRWLVYDVHIEGISLVSNYRNSFASEFKAKGVQGLIAALKQKNRTGAVRTADNGAPPRTKPC